MFPSAEWIGFLILRPSRIRRASEPNQPMPTSMPSTGSNCNTARTRLIGNKVDPVASPQLPVPEKMRGFQPSKCYKRSSSNLGATREEETVTGDTSFFTQAPPNPTYRYEPQQREGSNALKASPEWSRGSQPYKNSGENCRHRAKSLLFLLGSGLLVRIPENRCDCPLNIASAAAC